MSEHDQVHFHCSGPIHIVAPKKAGVGWTFCFIELREKQDKQSGLDWAVVSCLDLWLKEGMAFTITTVSAAAGGLCCYHWRFWPG